jgi:hypothetical protein
MGSDQRRLVLHTRNDARRVVEVRVGKAALGPVLLIMMSPACGTKIWVPFAAPGALRGGLALARSDLGVVGTCTPPHNHHAGAPARRIQLKSATAALRPMVASSARQHPRPAQGQTAFHP